MNEGFIMNESENLASLYFLPRYYQEENFAKT
jgi:hypothetical protein